jgi:hypothetical protein
VNDDRALVTSSYGYSQVHADVSTDQTWRKRQTTESFETFKLDAAQIFRDRWQAGVSLPVIRRAREENSEAGLGDITTSLGYEALPDWDYHPYRPRGLVFLQVTAPTGTPVAEAESDYLLDARGRGFWAVGVGTFLTKSFGRYDVFTSADVHHSFSRSYENGQARGELNPGFGSHLTVGAGYNRDKWRWGASLTSSSEEPVEISGPNPSQGASQRDMTASLSSSVSLKENWAATLSYNDQTWFGSPSNTSLSRGVTVLLQKRWLR